jgi:hypothetical protein
MRNSSTQLFHPQFSSLFKAGLVLAACCLAIAPFFCYWLYQTPYVTLAQRHEEQPIPFSHRHHVGGLGIDCRYCHVGVEHSAFAGLPSTHTCITCHSQIWTNAAMLAPVRESYDGPEPLGDGGRGADLRGGRPIRWKQVNRLPDFVFFNHGIHVHAGVACATCHGRVDQMAIIRKEKPLTMQWCLDCHRQPLGSIGSREDVFKMPPPRRTEAERTALAARYHIMPSHQLSNCTMCHR